MKTKRDGGGSLGRTLPQLEKEKQPLTSVCKDGGFNQGEDPKKQTIKKKR